MDTEGEEDRKTKLQAGKDAVSDEILHCKIIMCDSC